LRLVELLAAGAVVFVSDETYQRVWVGLTPQQWRVDDDLASRGFDSLLVGDVTVAKLSDLSRAFVESAQ
jgi:hypothetical protein